ncbi:MAG: 30S ribosomal protein S12 methylthiotransferase RimO [Armatimonadota bacterium]
MAKIALISLGCPKNLVDSEKALGEIVSNGYELVVDIQQADVVIVNTCGFIKDARLESIEEIEKALKLKEQGYCSAVIVMGCLSQRNYKELSKLYPQVDNWAGIADIRNLNAIIDDCLNNNIKKHIPSKQPKKWVEDNNRVLSTPPWTAYLKISDGCDNRCSYCSIPDIRGQFRSRPKEYIINEAISLAESGVKEIILIAQDLTKYGEDFGLNGELSNLLADLEKIENLKWIRLLYCYPTRIDDRLIGTIANSNKIVHYLDIPFQHGDNIMLEKMNRKGNVDQYLKLIDIIRSKIPDIALRSSFITGFPGETKENFENLKSFIKAIDFDRVGIFKYSPEKGTPAEKLNGRIDDDICQNRYDELMQIQQSISLKKNKAQIGKILDVLVESDGEYPFGRSYRDAPEIDGVVFLTDNTANCGDIIKTKITGAEEYDLIAKKLSR